MGRKAWWLVAAVGLAGCADGEEVAPVAEEEVLGTLRQAEAGGPVSWTRFARGAGLELASAVAQDRDGNVLTTVLFTGSADLGTGPLGSGEPEVPGVVLAKYSPDGRLLWTKVLQGARAGCSRWMRWARTVRATCCSRAGARQARRWGPWRP
ncbi:hypothetical protein ACLESO_41180 [Pyxidicoccus sp. 3LG]